MAGHRRLLTLAVNRSSAFGVLVISSYTGEAPAAFTIGCSAVPPTCMLLHSNPSSPTFFSLSRKPINAMGCSEEACAPPFPPFFSMQNEQPTGAAHGKLQPCSFLCLLSRDEARGQSFAISPWPRLRMRRGKATLGFGSSTSEAPVIPRKSLRWSYMATSLWSVSPKPTPASLVADSF